MQPTALFFSGKFHGQRSLVGYNPWGHKELDTTKQLTQKLTFAHIWKNTFDLHLVSQGASKPTLF